MGNGVVKYDWDLLLKEYLATGLTKSAFAVSKGINPSYLRRFTQDWPVHAKPKSQGIKTEKVTSVTLSAPLVAEKPKKEPKKKPKKESTKIVTAVALRASREHGKTVQQIVTSTEFENPEDLTPFEQAFCIFYNRNPNAGLCAMKAGARCKNMESAAAVGYQTLQKPSVKREITRLRKIRLASLAMTTEDITSRIVDMHMAIAFADIKDTLEFGTKKVPLRNETGNIIMIPDPKTKERKPVMVTENYVELLEFDRVDGRVIHKIAQSSKGGFSVTFEDRKASLLWLAEFFSINPMDNHKKEYDNKRLALEEKAMELKTKTGESIADAIKEAGVMAQTVAGLIGSPVKNRVLGDGEA